MFLKYLLTLRLTFFILSTLLRLGSCIHCILVCFLWSKKSTHSLSNHCLCCFHSCRSRLSLAEVLIFPLMFSQALLTFSSSFKFSKAAKPFLISIWYFSFTPSSFSFFRLNLSPSKFSAAFLRAANLYLSFVTTRKWSVSKSALLKPRTSGMLECRLLSINMWLIWLWVFPSGEV